MPIRLYKIDTRRLTLRECWTVTRSPGVLVLLVLKLVRVILPTPALPYLETMGQLAIAPESITPDIMAKLSLPMQELTQLGYHSVRYYRFASSRSQSEVYIAALLSPEGESIARVMHVLTHQTHPPKEKNRVFILSLLQDGTWLVSSPQAAEYDPIPGVEVRRKLRATPGELVRMQTGELDRRRVVNPPVRLGSAEEAEAVSERYEKFCFDFKHRRGLYVFLSDQEDRKEQEVIAATQQAAAEVGSEHADVLVELEKQANPKPGWKGAWWLLALSVLAFVGLGRTRWDWEYVLLLLPILLVHETGHWLAMRLFGYRNLRMFFIPLFGAAVTGNNYNVAGWKKALVSLAGPLPGILLATVAGFAVAAFPGHALLEKALLVTIVLNGFNLLPFVPLDGGWFLNAVLFSRHPWLETGFKLFAVIGLLAARIITGEGIWLFLGIMMALGLPSAWRTTRIAHRLRAQGLPTQSIDQRTIPPSTAVTIISAVKSATKMKRPAKTLATETLGVFEQMNARPPGWLASLGLLGLYGATLVAAFLGLGAVSLARFGGLSAFGFGDSEFDSKPTPLHAPWVFACGEQAAWNDGRPAPAPTNRLVLLGHFGDVPAAEAAFSQLTNSGHGVVTRFGQSAFVQLAGDDLAGTASVLAVFDPLGTNALRADARSNEVVIINLVCTMPSTAAATNLQAELESYFRVPSAARIAPPWLERAGMSPGQREAERKARHTWHALEEIKKTVDRDRKVRATQQKIFGALLGQDTNRLSTLREQNRQRRQELTRAAVSKLEQSGNRDLDQKLIELRTAHETARVAPRYGGLVEDSQDNDAYYLKVGQRLGQLPLREGEPALLDQDLTSYGLVSRSDAQLTLRRLSFSALGQGLPALTTWLCAQGCTDIRYDLSVEGEDK